MEPNIFTQGEVGTPPLTIPRELWEAMPREQQELYERAQAVLDVLTPEEPVALRDIVSQTHLATQDVLFALRALDGMSLVFVGTDGRQVMVQLLAVPDEHVPVVGPDGRTRWIFVARPLIEPRLEQERLN
jgi:hypothetical protein